MSTVTNECVKHYERLKNLKLVSNEVGIPWQTVYVHLCRAGVPVVGDKSRYGSDSDKLAAKAEKLFLKLVPYAEDQNRRTFQAKVDFLVNGLSVDVKSSRLKMHSSAGRWSFSLKKQRRYADYFVMFAYDKNANAVQKCFLFPGEIVRHYSTISISALGGKWADYEIDYEGIKKFFDDITSVMT